MPNFAAALSEHPLPTHAVGEAIGQVLEQLDGEPPDLAVLFVSPHHLGAVEDEATTIRELLRPQVLVGCTTAAVIGGAREVEGGPGLSLFAARLPGATLTPLALRVETTPDGPAVAGWPTGPDAERATTLLGLIDPFSFPGDAFLARLNEDRPDLRVVGGLASAARGPGGNRLVVNETVTEQGAVGVLVDQGIDVRTVVSQGCRPVGTPYVVTRAERNVVQELAGRPALERLEDLVVSLSEDDRELLQQGLHVGLVVDEHLDDFQRGDFLVRNVMGIDRDEGAIAIGDMVEVGQTLQFHVRDARTADEDLRELLAGESAAGALLFTCNGRGRHLFGEADHDVSVVETLLGPLPVSGMFCAGEIGPVGGRNFLHGFTASVALLRE